jgi:hypothetical protein
MSWLAAVEKPGGHGVIGVIGEAGREILANSKEQGVVNNEYSACPSPS